MPAPLHPKARKSPASTNQASLDSFVLRNIGPRVGGWGRMLRRPEDQRIARRPPQFVLQSLVVSEDESRKQLLTCADYHSMSWVMRLGRGRFPEVGPFAIRGGFALGK